MFTVYFRVFIKLFVFIFVAIFIIFFVVYWYRYDKNVWFIKKNVYLEYKFWSKNNMIQFDWKKYYSDDKFIKIYNIDNGCYDMKYLTKSYVKCFQDNQSFNDVYINSFWTKEIKDDLINYDCYWVSNQYHQEFNIKNKFFSEKIKNAFRFNEINFVQFEKSLKYCNDSYSICKDLSNLQWEVICWNDDWLIFYNTWYSILILK